MNGPHQVSINDLIKISKNLLNSFFPSTDIYSLLLLSLITVTLYSREIYHLNVYTRVELSIALLPDLINFLLKEGIITEKSSGNLIDQCKQKNDDIPLIIQSYIYAAEGLNSKKKIKKQKQCLII